MPDRLQSTPTPNLPSRTDQLEAFRAQIALVFNNRKRLETAFRLKNEIKEEVKKDGEPEPELLDDNETLAYLGRLAVILIFTRKACSYGVRRPAIDELVASMSGDEQMARTNRKIPFSHLMLINGRQLSMVTIGQLATTARAVLGAVCEDGPTLVHVEMAMIRMGLLQPDGHLWGYGSTPGRWRAV